jgi:ankyrin repeat protein
MAERETTWSGGALHLAAESGVAVLVKILLQGGADPNGQDYLKRTPLLRCLGTVNANIAIIRLLVDAKADIDHSSGTGETALHLVSTPHTAEYLLKACPSFPIDIREKTHGRTPLHCAAVRGLDDVVEVLLRAGADISLRDDRGKLAMDMAHECADKSALQILRRKDVKRQRISNGQYNWQAE